MSTRTEHLNVPAGVAESAPSAGWVRRRASGLLGRGGWSFLVATTGVNGFNFLFHVLASRLLGPSSYGALGALLNVISILSVPLGAIQLAVTQSVVARRENEGYSLRSLTWKSTAYSCVAMGVFWAFSPLLAGFLNLHSATPLFVLGTWIPLAILGAVWQGALLGEIRFVPVSIATFAGGGAFRLVMSVVLISAGFGLEGAVAATILGQALTTVMLLVIARRTIFASRAPIRISMRDAVLSIAALAGYTALTGIDVILARHFLASAEAGKYVAAAVAGHIALFLPGAFVTIAFPRFAADAGRTAASRKMLIEALVFVIVIGLAATGVIAALPRLSVSALFGSKYIAAASAVGLIALASTFLGAIGVLTYFQLARRSLTSLYSWGGIALMSVLVALLHGGIDTIAVCVLATSVLVFIAVLIPTLEALFRTSHERPESSWRLLPTPELDLTLVVPFYNPGARFRPHMEQVCTTLDGAAVTYEVIAVSDGSTDGSSATVGHLPDVRVVELPTNKGKGAALREGLAQGRGRYFGFIDADGDIPASELSAFVRALRGNGADIVLGNKSHPDSDVAFPPLRRMYSGVYQRLVSVLFRLATRDTQTGIKLMRREVIASVLPHMSEDRFAFDLELLVLAQHCGFHKLHELPVRIEKRLTSTVSPKAVLQTLLDTFGIFYRLRISKSYSAGQIISPFEGIGDPGLESISTNGTLLPVPELSSALVSSMAVGSDGSEA